MPENEIEQLRREMDELRMAMGHVSLAADNNPWIVTHHTLIENIETVWGDNPEAKAVLHDIVQTVAILSTKFLNMFAGTSFMAAFADPAFRELLDQQREVVKAAGGGHATTLAITSLSDTVRDEIHGKYAEYVEGTGANPVTDLKRSATNMMPGS